MHFLYRYISHQSLYVCIIHEHLILELEATVVCVHFLQCDIYIYIYILIIFLLHKIISYQLTCTCVRLVRIYIRSALKQYMRAVSLSLSCSIHDIHFLPHTPCVVLLPLPQALEDIVLLLCFLLLLVIAASPRVGKNPIVLVIFAKLLSCALPMLLYAGGVHFFEMKRQNVRYTRANNINEYFAGTYGLCVCRLWWRPDRRKIFRGKRFLAFFFYLCAYNFRRRAITTLPFLTRPDLFLNFLSRCRFRF